MQFSDIIKTIYDAWTFSWPPLIMCLITYMIAKFLNKEGLQKIVDCLYSHMIEYGKKIDKLRSTLEPYGLTKIIPITSFIVLIAILFLLNGPITVMVSYLPPYLVYQPDNLILERSPENDILLLLREYPTARTFNQAYYLADSDHKDKIKDNFHRAEIYYKIHNFVKYGFFISLIFVIINIKKRAGAVKQILKFCLLFVLFSFIWLGSLPGLLYQEEQRIYDEWRTIQIQMQKDANTLLEKPINDEEKKLLNKHLVYRNKKWWRISFMNTYRIEWIYRTFMPRDYLYTHN